VAGLLLYDDDCGFCTRVATRVLPLLRLEVQVGAIGATDLAEVGVDPDRAVREMPFVAASGAVVYGHVAWAQALKTGAWPWRMVGHAIGSRVLNGLSARVYRWVADHRHQLPGGSASCELPKS
jgi:predicted DCC family thiol-disulfide oxidoreductase YuxK